MEYCMIELISYNYDLQGSIWDAAYRNQNCFHLTQDVVKVVHLYFREPSLYAILLCN